jgi:hypothetical protein
MNIREELLKERSKAQMHQIRDYIGDDPERFSELMEILLNDTPKLMEYAAWALSHCMDEHPQLVAPYVKYLIPHAKEAPHSAVARNITRALSMTNLNPDDQGSAFDLCWEFAESSKQEIAVRVHSLTVLGRVAKNYPELAAEVFALAKGFQEYDSPGLRSRGRRVAEDMEKLIAKAKD